MAAAEDDELTTAARRAFATPFAGVIRLLPPESAALWVDGRSSPPSVSAEWAEALGEETASCIWRASRETLIRILRGERLLGSSFLSGRLAISGDLSIMARLKLEGAARG